MIVIYVQKTWLDTIGGAAEILLIRDEHKDIVSIFAAKVEANYPFVSADLARTTIGDGGECFMPVMIPTSLVMGTCDLTEGETAKMGFHQPKKA